MEVEENQFYDNVIYLTGMIKDQVRMASSHGMELIKMVYLDLATAFITAYNRKQLIEDFISFSHQFCWEMIKKKDVKFFIEHADGIFSCLPAIPAKNVKVFHTLFTSRIPNSNEPLIDEITLEDMWSVFEALVRISICYVNRTRSVTGGKLKEVELEKHAGIWEIDL